MEFGIILHKERMLPEMRFKYGLRPPDRPMNNALVFIDPTLFAG